MPPVAMVPMTAEQRAEVCARLDKIAAELASLRRRIDDLKADEGCS